MERNRWPIVTVVATYKYNKGVVRSIRPFMGSVDRANHKSRYLEQPEENKVENKAKMV